MSTPRAGSSRTLATALAALALFATALPAQEPAQKDVRAADLKGEEAPQLISGVITKVEPVTKGASAGSTVDETAKEGKQLPRLVRLTINSEIPWSDWVRDQATAAPATTGKKDEAKKEVGSVATKGQPNSAQALVPIDLGPGLKVVDRYRSSTDETDEGGRTVESAQKKATDPAQAKPNAKSKAAAAKAPKYTVETLKPGLFVEVEYRHTQAQNRAISLVVLHPIGGADTPAVDALPEKDAKKP